MSATTTKPSGEAEGELYLMPQPSENSSLVLLVLLVLIRHWTIEGEVVREPGLKSFCQRLLVEVLVLVTDQASTL